MEEKRRKRKGVKKERRRKEEEGKEEERRRKKEEERWKVKNLTKYQLNFLHMISPAHIPFCLVFIGSEDH